MNRDREIGFRSTTRTDRPTLGDVELDLALRFQFVATAHAAPKLRPKPHGRQGPQFEQNPQPRIRLALRDDLQRFDRKGIESLKISRSPPFGR